MFRLASMRTRYGASDSLQSRCSRGSVQSGAAIYPADCASHSEREASSKDILAVARTGRFHATRSCSRRSSCSSLVNSLSPRIGRSMRAIGQSGALMSGQSERRLRGHPTRFFRPQPARPRLRGRAGDDSSPDGRSGAASVTPAERRARRLAVGRDAQRAWSRRGATGKRSRDEPE